MARSTPTASATSASTTADAIGGDNHVDDNRIDSDCPRHLPVARAGPWRTTSEPRLDVVRGMSERTA
ncbi:hypothetical protein ACFOZ7_22210 [Natribaculum luteum]|uniref:Uncharacterized protein n=1 Tax=Natribaculum luteum TaxID=1586232 RepID=A0ABD5P5Y9_9EURY|nr:hypothetical protein [Natribaculum luteum]